MWCTSRPASVVTIFTVVWRPEMGFGKPIWVSSCGEATLEKTAHAFAQLGGLSGAAIHLDEVLATASCGTVEIAFTALDGHRRNSAAIEGHRVGGRHEGAACFCDGSGGDEHVRPGGSLLR